MRTYQSCGDTGSNHSSGVDVCGGPAADLKFSSPVRAIMKHDQPTATVIANLIARESFLNSVCGRVDTDHKILLVARSCLAPRYKVTRVATLSE